MTHQPINGAKTPQPNCIRLGLQPFCGGVPCPHNDVYATIMKHPNNKVQTGFTLLELLVVVVIVGLLSGLVAPRFFGSVEKTKTKVAEAQIESLGKALDQFRLDVGRYPTSEQGLQALVTAPTGTTGWSGPYLKKGVPPDPWGAAYIYRHPSKVADYEILSLGADGKEGGADADADVRSWVAAEQAKP